jgi:hypothetical protein
MAVAEPAQTVTARSRTGWIHNGSGPSARITAFPLACSAVQPTPHSDAVQGMRAVLCTRYQVTK